MKYSYYLQVEGLNLNKLFNSLYNKNIKIYNLIRPNFKTCQFGLSFFDYWLAKKYGILKSFKVKIINTHNLGFLSCGFIKHIGLYLGAVCSIVFIVLISNVTLKINVFGLSTISKQDIVSSLSDIGVVTGKIIKKTNEEIEKYLKENNANISLVSVARKGTNLIVNIKEKESSVVEDFSPMCAPYNMVVNSINVVQGVAKVKAGDVVKKGDVLVDPKIVLTSGKATQLKPMANISATIWITGNIHFKTEETVYVKTGKKQTISCFEWNGVQLFSSGAQLKFENYEKKVYNNYVFENMFIPLRLNTVTYYETKPEKVVRNFEENKADLILESKKLAYQKLPKGLSVDNEMVNISQSGNTYFITTYLEVNYMIEG